MVRIVFHNPRNNDVAHSHEENYQNRQALLKNLKASYATSHVVAAAAKGEDAVESYADGGYFARKEKRMALMISKNHIYYSLILAVVVMMTKKKLLADILRNNFLALNHHVLSLFDEGCIRLILTGERSYEIVISLHY